jgi:hypothetical protein
MREALQAACLIAIALRAAQPSSRDPGSPDPPGQDPGSWSKTFLPGGHGGADGLPLAPTFLEEPKGRAMARYTYRLTPTEAGYLAACMEIDAEGEGATRAAAVSCLHEAIRERMSTAQAVAPPARTPTSAVELIEAAPAPDSGLARSPQGPGEPR